MEFISQKFWNFILKNSEIYFSYSNNKTQNPAFRILEFNSLTRQNFKLTRDP